MKIIAYVLAMGVCGLVLVALGSTLEFLAQHVGLRATDIGSVFLARGVGSISGAIICAKLYRWCPGNFVMAASLFALMVLLAILPSCRYVIFLHISFLLLGAGTAVTDTGCQLMTRKLHERKAGPWLGLNATMFGLSAAFVPLLEVMTSNTYQQYLILTGIVCCTSAYMLFVAIDGRFFLDGETIGPLRTATSEDAGDDRVEQSVPHFYTEICIAIMLFCFVGGSIAATAYIESYIEQIGIIDERHKSRVVFVLWISITLGRFVGVRDQIALSDYGLFVDLTFFCVGGSLGMFLIYMFPSSPLALWIGVAAYGFFHGPTVGFCQDLNNRLTLPTEKSMAIVMFGLNVGASVVPYFTAVLWQWHGNNPGVLIVVVGLSMVIPLPLMYISKYVSYQKGVAGYPRSHRQLSIQSYESVQLADTAGDDDPEMHTVMSVSEDVGTDVPGVGPPVVITVVTPVVIPVLTPIVRQ